MFPQSWRQRFWVATLPASARRLEMCLLPSLGYLHARANTHAATSLSAEFVSFLCTSEGGDAFIVRKEPRGVVQ